MMLRERAVRRPNGKIYVPRKGLEIMEFTGHHYYPPRRNERLNYTEPGYHDYDVPFIGVLRTHDIDEARAFIGDVRFQSEYLHAPYRDWLSLSYHYGELTWCHNPEHGMPVVIFREEDYPEEPA